MRIHLKIHGEFYWAVHYKNGSHCSHSVYKLFGGLYFMLNSRIFSHSYFELEAVLGRIVTDIRSRLCSWRNVEDKEINRHLCSPSEFLLRSLSLDCL